MTRRPLIIVRHGGNGDNLKLGSDKALNFFNLLIDGELLKELINWA